MSVNIEMPKLSDTMTEGTLIKWNKQVGDAIEIGDILAEVETDKATMEMESFDEGVLARILVEAGQKAEVGAVLGVIAEDGEELDSDASPVTASSSQPESSPVLEQSALEVSADSLVQGSSDSQRVKASPLARKIAQSKGIDLHAVQGTGPGGRIVKADVESVVPQPASLLSSAKALVASAKQQQAATAPSPKVESIEPSFKEEDELVSLSSMRRIIAERLLTSKTTIPHFYLHIEVDTEPLMALRKQINAQSEKTNGNKYSVNDFIIKATINASQSVKAVNASFSSEGIVQYAKIGISVAVAVDEGLVTPVIKDAASKSLLQISKEVKDMAKRARDKKLMPHEFDGGTITISNLGAWGVESFDAIVNPPQAAILSIGGISQKPVVKEGQIVVGQRMNIGLSCDHRVIDGAVGATFLAEVKKLIESPALMLV